MKRNLLKFFFIMIFINVKSQTYENPVTFITFYNYFFNTLKLNEVSNNKESTILTITYKNTKYTNGWFSIKKNSYLLDGNTNQKYFLKDVENIKYSPEKTNLDKNEEKTFKLYFEKLPKNCNYFHFIEDTLNIENFKILNIKLDIKPIEYYPYFDEIKRILPEDILYFFNDGYNYIPFEITFAGLKDKQIKDERYGNFEISDTLYDTKSKLNIINYSFIFNDIKITFQKNVTYDCNRIIYFEFENEYQLNRTITCFEKVFFIKKEMGGFYNFPTRILDIISIINEKKIAYLSTK